MSFSGEKKSHFAHLGQPVEVRPIDEIECFVAGYGDFQAAGRQRFVGWFRREFAVRRRLYPVEVDGVFRRIGHRIDHGVERPQRFERQAQVARRYAECLVTRQIAQRFDSCRFGRGFQMGIVRR